ncbi:MAG: dTDP-glucose 4,6-dehydratase [Desulfomonile tiedjei]|uniref:dTDP-glucose 4,6-dehydratase n=1 Tax=Desulfomonile tiedjei TaxID=2358 RepID=A0A9D6V3Q3_9BACT|nr:dTDP-glucose 4,6-dehydratase [Desulfomonile tiedjei]
MKLLVTGGCGFIGSNFIIHMMESYPDVNVINLDLLTYAGNLENLQDVAPYGSRHRFVRGDISDKETVRCLLAEKPDVVVNFAAESHVDRSIMDCCSFIHTNIRGTQVLLDACREYKIPRFVQISTDEVYGSLHAEEPPFTEDNQICPNSPYAASKASADLLVRSYHKTYGMDVVITRCSNNYGPLQFPEKLIPLMITNALQDFELPVYGDGRNVRDWIHVRDHCRAIDAVMRKGRPGDVYNIGSEAEFHNIDIVRYILCRLDKPESLIRYVEDRPGHDRRYGMNAAKLRSELGWTPLISFEDGMNQTVSWYIEHEMWWQRIRTGEYLNYYEDWYGKSLGAANSKPKC